MARGQQLYYEEQVAKGREDYYAGKGEAPGRWTGRGTELLGLEGELDVERLKALMDGKHPATGERLAIRSGNVSTAAIDMTFSAPKSVSLLFAIGDEQLSAALVDAHEEAVDAALAYVEDVACRVRRGHNGTREERERGDPRGWERARSEPAGGFVAAAYRHRMSRAQDPQLHTHVVAANMAQGRDGRWTALDAKHIYEHAKAAGSVYQAHLRRAVRERLPWASWGKERNGMAELEQVPEPVLREFSTRRNRILERERELVGAGVAVGDAGRERIAFDTREAKREVDERDWRGEVRARAAEHGFGQDRLDWLATLPRVRTAERPTELELIDRLFGPSGLTARSNTFGERDVVAAVAAAAAQGMQGRELVAGARRVLAAPEVIAVRDAGRRFTTRELLDAEQRIVAVAVRGKGQGAAVVDEVQALQTLSRAGRPLSGEQERVVIGVVESGDRVDTVEALAGTGKTTSAAALRAVYERAGYRVIGAAPTGRAVRELKEQAGICESRTLDGWLFALENDPDALRFDSAAGPAPAVMILDEAGMASTRLTARLFEAASTANVKVVAFGDSGQLASVQAGGWLGALTRHVGSFELREVMRQRDPQERRGLAKLHRGEPETYLQLKAARDELTVFKGGHAQIETEHAAIEKLLAARERLGPEQAVLVCRDNQRRDRLNELARERLRAWGELGEGVMLAGREWCVGERVVARRNDRERDLDNGTRGTIIRVDERDGLRVQTDGGQIRQIDLEYASQHLQYAYALTGHGMQGGTVEWAGVVGRPSDFSRNWSYTALSRAREPTAILLVDDRSQIERDRAEIAPEHNPGPAADPVGRMAVRMRERDDEDLAIEQLACDELVEEPAGAVAGLQSAGQAGRVRLRALSDELDQINRQLAELPLDDLKRHELTERTIASLHREHARVSQQRGWRDRSVRTFTLGQIERRLADEQARRQELREQIGDPRAVAEHAGQLRQRRSELSAEHRSARDGLIVEELDRQPDWLLHALGPEPQALDLQDRWRQAGRRLAGHRLDHDITDPERALGTRRDRSTTGRAVHRELTEARIALGLAPGAPERGAGLEID